MDDKLAAALIAAAVSVVGSALTLLSARWQLKSKLRQLEQAQLKEVLEARIKAYPKLWRILQTQVSNWHMEGKPANGAWAKKLYEGLNSCHATYGVLFSQPVYDSFCEVREAASKLAETYSPEQEVPAEAVRELDVIWSGRGKPGLATQLKDDLGSYRSTLISARKPNGT
jgi:hypothetical protein